ncbi:hypothetical protein BAR1_06620 [Profundibacter amoris]|uniref:Uncharacterized protein n=1 Tax=Profundibacter amoris TaxID=2171755 RepID=A0A347UFK4_9RHOB|nr:hypothetical protein BAR1_06620 [Profundibacter amoris]
MLRDRDRLRDLERLRLRDRLRDLDRLSAPEPLAAAPAPSPDPVPKVLTSCDCPPGSTWTSLLFL